ncbi:hypothetical protein DL346_09085 [Paenibacillus montanisoli]|uniref:Uncharacterized protein n=1 Tax=Paenibacillus montanisoli TaxID=2081970 RepID=A0A328UCA1_9BACL|nr:hypothetical protein DL346_09085 [Paenibacillus montanisoli]
MAKQRWEMTLQERLERVRKRVPKSVNMNDYVVKTVHDIPFEDREKFELKLRMALYTLGLHYSWWLRVHDEISKPEWSRPKLKLIK